MGIPIIVHPLLRPLMRYLADTEVQAKAGIPSNNPYLFAWGDGAISIYEAVSKLAAASDLIYPERMGCTLYRKYMATYVQVICTGNDDTHIFY